MKIVSIITQSLLGLIFLQSLAGTDFSIFTPTSRRRQTRLRYSSSISISAFAFCCVLLRRAVDRRVAVAFRLLCAARAHGAAAELYTLLSRFI